MTATALAAGSQVAATSRALRDALAPPAWLGYLLRVSVSVTATLYLAFRLELPTPYSAVTTVFIVANPVRGAIVSKSAWRLAGTVAGAIAAVIQFAIFGQSPLLFDLFIAVWVGLCCGASTLLRFFRSYGTVLAGYTVVIVDVGGLGAPDHALGVALSRVSVVTLGIVVTGLVFLLTQGARKPSSFARDITASTVALAALIRAVLDGEPLDSMRVKRRALAAQIVGYEQSIVFASADDLDVRAQSLALRVAITDLLAALTDGLQAALIIREQADARDGAERRAAGGVLAEALDAIAGSAIDDRPRARLAVQRSAEDLAASRERCRDLDTLASLELARLTLERFDGVLADVERSGERRPRSTIRLRPFLDVGNAVRNGIRGFLAVAIASLFWYLTYWPEGPTLLAYVTPAAALLSTNPSPGAAAVKFVQGTVLAVIMAVICQGLILPRVSDFVPLALLLMLFAGPGVVMQLNPTWGGAAFSYVVFFNTNLGLENAMVFDLPTLLANAEAYFVGCAGLLLTFRILLPPDPALAVRQIARALGGEGQRLARAEHLPEPKMWEHIQLQRILQIGLRLDAMGSPGRGKVVEDAAAGMILGRTVIRLRGLLDQGRMGEASCGALREALRCLGSLRRAPARCAVEIEGAARRILDDAPAPDRLQTTALLQIASRLVATHAEFFERGSRFEGALEAAAV